MPYYETGTATDEQDLVGKLDTFLTSVVGTWTKIDTVTDDPSTKDLVFHSPGHGTHRDIYLRFRGSVNFVYIYGYSFWASSVDYDGEIYNSNHTCVATGSNSINYWFFGDVDYVWFVVEDSVATTYCSGYGGLIESYYSPELDDLPLAVVGCYSYTYALNNNRIYMYSATASGVAIEHTIFNLYTPLLSYGDPSDRVSGVNAHAPFIVYSISTGSKEIRGELKGALYFSGASFSSGDIVTISGTNDSYLIKKYSDTNCEAIGPIV